MQCGCQSGSDREKGEGKVRAITLPLSSVGGASELVDLRVKGSIPLADIFFSFIIFFFLFISAYESEQNK